MRAVALTLFSFFLLLGVSYAHVALTYPLPRKINYDFMDNFRTPEPCGGQHKAEPLSEFTSGETVNITWHLGYPHRGGYRIELLQEDDNVTNAVKLLPKGSAEWTGENDTTSTWAEVSIPDGDCNNCTIRLVRQALEWGPTYIFWTCADVNIISGASMFCSMKGNYTNGRCMCEKFYYGDRCQYWNDCDQDSDCSNGGKCIDTHAVSSPRKQCFCAKGFFGDKCSKVSARNSIPTDLTDYRKNTLSPDYVLYHKIMSDEVEMVLRVKTNTWAGIGWKPTGSLNCRDIGKPTAEPEPEGTAEPEGSAEPETKPEPESTAEPETTAEPEGTAEPETHGNYTKTDAPTVIISTDEEYLKSQGLDLKLATYECVVGKGGQAKPEPEGEGEPTTEPKPEGKPEGKAEGEPEGEGEPEAEANDSGHPMDCADMVIIAANGAYSRVHDAFTRDRSTPMFDTMLGGVNSLTAAVAEEDGEYTHVLIRRKLTASDSTDHSIVDELMTVIWAMGQQHLNYIHQPPTGLEFCDVMDIFFYRRDVLMYHGHQGQRGATSINFITAPQTKADSYSLNEETSVEWVYKKSNNEVEFTLLSPLSAGQWVAFGITSNKEMKDTDIFVVGVDQSGQATASNRYSSGYGLPPKDDGSSQTSVDYTDGKIEAKITKPVNPNTDDDITLSRCQHLTIATGSGYDGDRFNRHDSTPAVSENKYCFVKVEASSSNVAIADFLFLLAAFVIIRFL